MNAWLPRAAWLAVALAPFASAQDKVLNPSAILPRTILHFPFEKLNDSQIGTWLMAAHVASTLSDAMFLQIDGTTHTGGNGTVYLVVKHAFSPTPTALVSFTSYGKWLLLLDIGTGYYRLYEYSANHDEAAGLYWLYQTSGTPTGNGSWLRGFRFANGAGGVMKTASPSVPPEDVELLAALPKGRPPTRIVALAKEVARDYEALRH